MYIYVHVHFVVIYLAESEIFFFRNFSKVNNYIDLYYY